jgi:hypothetical protein
MNAGRRIIFWIAPGLIKADTPEENLVNELVINSVLSSGFKSQLDIRPIEKLFIKNQAFPVGIPV